MKARGISIGEVAQRSGVAVSALRFYEERGLVRPDRDAGGRRIFERADLRRIAFIRIAQELGFSLPQVATALDSLPQGRTPDKADWTRLSTAFRADLDRRIEGLSRLRDRLDKCIGCGCLSLESCGLYNPQDRAAERGSGAQMIWPREDEA